MASSMNQQPKYPWPNKPRTPVCWNCKSKLHSDKNPECSFCHAIVCDCGACGCDSPTWDQDMADELYEYRKERIEGWMRHLQTVFNEKG